MTLRIHRPAEVDDPDIVSKYYAMVAAKHGQIEVHQTWHEVVTREVFPSSVAYGRAKLAAQSILC